MLVRAATIPLLLVLLGAPVGAQNLPQQPVTLERPDSCTTGRISYVFIDNNSIFDTTDSDLNERFLWAYRAANALHVRTKQWVIRRELLFAPGMCFDPYLLGETERLLRGYNFLAHVDVFAVQQADGSYHVIVDTRDEWSTRVDVRLNTTRGVSLEGVRLTEDNLFGSGQSLGAFYFEHEVTRDYGLSYYAPQLLGTRWDLATAAGRTRAGTFVQQEVAYPFVGEVSRWAGRQSFRREDQFFNYIAADDRSLQAAHVLVPLREQAFDLSVLRRIGDRGNMALVGGALSYQKLSYPGVVQIAERGDFDERGPAGDTVASAVRTQRETIDNIRAFVLVGHRNVWWVRRRGLDSMRGQEDIRLGAEAILALGRSMPSLERDDDLYAMLALYTGFDVGDALVIGRTRLDGRRDLTAAADEPEWEDLYIDSEILTYLQTPRLPRQTVLLRAALLASWNTRTPFQLTLGGVHALRGYDQERLPGGRRLVVTAEDRFFIGWPLPDVMDLGGTVFTDVGRIWPGDAPFGIDSGWRISAGFGLRGSFPPSSRSSYRVDIAWPLDRGATLRDYRLSFTIGESRGHNPREPDRQIVRSRTQNVAGDLFTFRN